MEPTIELRVAELLASRLCHDLVSPVGAVNTGIELMTEFDEGPDGESMALIQSSGRQAADKLQFFRIAYGSSGAGEGIGFGEGLPLIAPVCANQRTTVEIEDGSAGERPGAGAVKLLLNAALLAGECLPRGGVLAVAIGPDMTASLTASGEGARIEAKARDALAGIATVADLDPRSAHAYFTAMVARRMGVAIDLSEATDSVIFSMALPAV